MEEKAQANLEYLLIIVGAIVIATIIAIFGKTIIGTTTGAIEEAAN